MSRSIETSQRIAPGTDGLWAALVAFAALLLTRPFIDMGLSDEVSYVKTAWLFAHTGHFFYNGWATAMLGWQIVWTAPFIWVFGPTWFACKFSTAVMFFLMVWLVHAILRRAGVPRAHAFFGALVVGLCPLTLQVSVTYMTDTSGMLVMAAVFYCALRTVQAQSDRATLLWLTLGFLAGIFGGTSRQIMWLAALLLMPSAAWCVRRRRGVVALSFVLWVATLAFMRGCMYWFAHQPYNVPEPLIQGHFHPGQAVHSYALQIVQLALCSALLILPVFALSFRPVLRAGIWKVVLLVLLTVAATLIVHVPSRHWLMGGWAPWAQDFVAQLDVYPATNRWGPGTAPASFSTYQREAVSFVVVGAVLAFAWAAWRGRRGRVSTPQAAALGWRELLILCVPFTAGYLVLLAPRAIWANLIDRYTLPLLILAVVLLVRLAAERINPRVDAAAWATLAVIALWGICGVHDWVADYRARTKAFDNLRAQGVPAENISAGFGLDALTQIEKAGAISDPRVKYPAGFDTQQHFPAGLPAECRYLYDANTPALRPQYFITYAPEPPCTTTAGEVDYRAWLPPFHRLQLVRKLDSQWQYNP